VKKLFERFKSQILSKFKFEAKASSTEEYIHGAGRKFPVTYKILIVSIVFCSILLGVYWSNEPDTFPVVKLNSTVTPTRVGFITTSTVIEMVEILIEKPGGLVSNDIMPPGIWLDNIKNWEYGVLIQIRDVSKAMRESFSRSQSQSMENPDLALAEPRFNVDHKSWAIPWPEREYKDGQSYLKDYLDNLQNEREYTAQFFARADNLSYWLGSVEKRLGSLSQRLAASVGQRRVNTDLSGDMSTSGSIGAPSELFVKTDWLKIDDIFYEARGTSWALLHLLKAAEVDFEEVLINKNAAASLKQIIRELEMTQQAVFSPIIVNGRGFGLLANHSLIMASYISRAHSALLDLRDLLARG
tara:strand:- start:385 stop:1452 length:1068 start_codon:yes stop_codon:yes gene_type:complete